MSEEKATVKGSSTLGSFNEIPTEQIITAPTPENSSAPLPSDTVVNSNGGMEATSNNTIETPIDANSEQPAFESNEAGLDLSYLDETPAATNLNQQQTQQSQFDWKKEIKNIDQKELFKELGLDEFDIEFANYRRNGGDPYKYLEAKAFDWNKVNDTDVMRMEFNRKYPNLTPEQKNFLFNKKYIATEDEDDNVKIEKQIALQADAYEVKQREISQQQNFKIPEYKTAIEEKQQLEQIQQQLQLQQQQTEAAKQYIANHPSVQNLMNSKRVAIDLGKDIKSFNYKIDKPELLLKAIVDGDFYKRIVTNEKGELNVDKLIRITKYALDPDKHDKDLFNYGKGYGVMHLVNEGQNATKEHGLQPRNGAPVTDEKQVWKGAKQSTIGSLGRN